MIEFPIIPPMVFSFVQIAYWLALATWFGAVLFVAMAPPIILRTVRENDPMLPHVLSVNLEGQHATLLSQSIVGQLIAPLHRVEVACAAVLLVALIGQWFVLHPRGLEITLPLVRSALLVAATIMLIYDWRVVWPRMWNYRQEYLDHADEPDVANAALDQFDRAQATSLLVLQIILGVLLAMILFSANIQAPSQSFVFTSR